MVWREGLWGGAAGIGFGVGVMVIIVVIDTVGKFTVEAGGGVGM